MKKWIGGILGVIGAITLIWGIYTKIKRSISFSSAASIGIIGAADGPTSIFLAGKLGSRYSIYGVICGAVLLMIGFIILIRKKK